MNRELINMQANIEDKKAEARKLLENKEIAKAEALVEEIETLQKEFNLSLKLFNDQKAGIHNNSNPKPIVPAEDTPQRTEKTEFLNAMRHRPFDNALVKRDEAEGGYTVPRDIQTQINEYREARDELSRLVTVESVTTFEGARTFKKRSQQKGFTKIEELEELTEKATPQFERLKYRVEKFGGFFPASSEILADSDQVLENALIRWIANESRVTRNKLVLDVLDQQIKTPIQHPDDVKKTLNVTLDPAFRNTSNIVTNQDGFHYLDTLKFDDGRYMLQETLAFRTGYSLLGRQVVVISNNDLPTIGREAPILIGDLQEAVILFDRKQLNVMHTNVGGNAFMTDSHIWRAIERLDCVMRDDQAFVYGQIDLDKAPNI